MRAVAIKFSAMPFGLQVKDLVGPAISVIAAICSLIFFFKNRDLTKRLAERSIYLEGQKFTIEICKQLIADPLLWCLFDRHALVSANQAKLNDPLFQGKLTAFGHLHLNMFEIMLLETADSAREDATSQSVVWIEYFRYSLDQSRALQALLEEEGSEKIWGSKLREEYERWKVKARGG